MMGWFISLGILALILACPVGVSLRYQEDGFLIYVLADWIKIKIFPIKKREKNSVKVQKSQPSKDNKVGQNKPKGGNIKDFTPLIKLGLEFLQDLKHKIRVRYLQLYLVLAEEDPCDLAIHCGKANAAAAAFLAKLDSSFYIKKQDVKIDCDFQAEETSVTARLDVTITVLRLLVLVACFAVRALKIYMNLNKQRESGAFL